MYLTNFQKTWLMQIEESVNKYFEICRVLMQTYPAATFLDEAQWHATASNDERRRLHFCEQWTLLLHSVESPIFSSLHSLAFLVEWTEQSAFFNNYC